MIINEYIKKGIDNLRFARNLDDYIPRYRQVLMEQIEHKDEKVIQEAGDLVILVEIRTFTGTITQGIRCNLE